jgi:hypothetical protein
VHETVSEACPAGEARPHVNMPVRARARTSRTEGSAAGQSPELWVTSAVTQIWGVAACARYHQQCLVQHMAREACFTIRSPPSQSTAGGPEDVA